MKQELCELPCVFLLLAGVVPGQTTPPRQESPASAAVMNSYGRLPLAFEANQGQTDPQVKFVSRGGGHSFFLTSREAVLVLEKRVARRHSIGRLPAPPESTSPAAVLRMRLLGINPAAQVSGTEELPGKSNYFIGNDPKQWRSNVPNYARVRYRDVYPGIDLVYYGNQGQLEHDFVVAPEADPSRILLALRGVKGLRIEENGDLRMRVGDGDIRLLKPSIYQEVAGKRRPVEGRYVLKGKQSFGFAVAAYDRRRPLVIDPVLSYSTYLAGDADSGGYDIAVDAAGSAYVTGYTSSYTFPTTSDAFQTTSTNPVGYQYSDVFVTKLNAAGSSVAYSTYLGGSYNEWGQGIAVDAAGNAYVTGYTYSTDFPTTSGAFQRDLPRAANLGVFVTKVNAAGNGLVYSTYLGHGDLSYGIAVDAAGNAYVTGYANSCSHQAQYNWQRPGLLHLLGRPWP